MRPPRHGLSEGTRRRMAAFTPEPCASGSSLAWARRARMHLLSNAAMTALPKAVAALTVAALLFATGRFAAADVTPQQRCAVAKMRATAREAAARLRCNAKAVLNNAAVDSVCIMKAETAFTAAFAKAEATGGCATTGDASAVDVKVDTFVTATYDALAPLGPFCATPDSPCGTCTAGGLCVLDVSGGLVCRNTNSMACTTSCASDAGCGDPHFVCVGSAPPGTCCGICR